MFQTYQFHTNWSTAGITKKRGW